MRLPRGAYSKLPYNPVTDFTPISLVAITPYLLVVNPQVQARNLNEFLALAKSQPGKLNYASAGNGTATHLAMEMLKDAAKIDLVHVPYKGNAPADTAILQAKCRQYLVRCRRCCKTPRRTRYVRLPSVPQRARPRYPTYLPLPSRAIRVSRRRCGSASWAQPTAEPVVDRLHKEIVAIVATPEFKASMDANGAEPIAKAPEEFREMLRGQVDKYGKITKAIGIKLD